MPSYKIELNSNPNKESKEYKLMLRITINRKHSRIALDYSVTKNQFNPNPKQQNKYIRQNNSKHVTINTHIDEKIQQAKDAARDLEQEGKLVTSRTIKQRMIQPKSSSFFDFAEKHINALKKNNNIGNWKKYSVVLKKLKEYKSNEDLIFLDIEVQFLEDFQAHLKSLGNNQTTIHGNFRAIRALYYKAIDKGLVQQSQNPFFSFKLKSGNPSRTRLTEEEIKVVEKLELHEGELIWHVKNAFLFAFYVAGMRASDIIMLKWSNIQNGRLIYTMHKTGKLHSLKITDQARKILDYYGTKEPNEYIFPFFKSDIDYSDPMFLHNQISAKTALINKYLKTMATKAGINKKISTHTARHSFADIARKKTKNLYNLSKTLGHSDLKTTENYIASFDDEAVDSTLDDVFG